MPLFVLYGIDQPNGVEIRKATRQSHLDWINSLAPRVKIAGPMYAEDGATPVGSMMAIEADTLAEAKTIFAKDPYATAGLWAKADVRQFNWIIKQ
jgi:uncharacterized protein